jgi:hypothetical protein
MQPRYQWQVNQAVKQENNYKDRKRAIELLNDTNQVCDPCLVPVCTVLTADEMWIQAANKTNTNTANKTQEEIQMNTMQRWLHITDKKSKTNNDLVQDPTRIQHLRTIKSAKYDPKIRPMRHDLVAHQLTTPTTIGNITLHPTTDLWTTEHGQDLNDNCLDAVMTLIATYYGQAKAVSSHFSTVLRTRGWNEAKRMLPKCDDTKDALLIPIHTGGNTMARHWSLLIRKPNPQRTNTTCFNFYYYDSLNSPQRAKSTWRIMRNTPLYSPRDDSWNTPSNAAPNKAAHADQSQR